MPTTSGTWYQWVEAAADTSTSASSTAVTVWQAWNDGTANTSYRIASSSTAANANTVWSIWNGETYQSVRRTAYTPRRLTAEELAAHRAEMERRRAEDRAREAEQARLRAEADARANELLDAHLSEEQRRQLRELDAFIVNAKSKQYRIRRGWAGNVDEIKDGVIVARYCIHPYESVPYGDHMLAQKFLLETNEAEFVRIANKTVLPTPEPIRTLQPLAN